MNNAMKRVLAMLIVLVMCIALLPALNVEASAANVNYVKSGDYIYNWGTREEVATFLSPNAESFYTGNYTYDALAAYSGGTSEKDAPDSALYAQLHNLMENKHNDGKITSYQETRDLYMYTDCQKSGGKISSFYSGEAIGPDWDSGNTWNREHTWPNSKSLHDKSHDSADIMTLRPTSVKENSNRGNTAYGKSSGYYNPNSVSGGKYDLRGDVARIFLYVYVRWENTEGNGEHDTWGSDGVMESLNVLLEWIEEDPVDTWELGRNDSVESITGTRNVFVDYPEFAFLLFGEEIPSDMQTPSGEAAGNNCGHDSFGTGVVTAPTCTVGGYTTYTCTIVGCGYSYKTNTTAATGHSYKNGVCANCGEAKPVEPTYITEVVTGKAFKLGFFSTKNNAEYYFTGSMDTNNSYYGATSTDYAKGVDVYAESTTGGYRLYFKNNSNQKQYINLVVNNTHRNFTFSTTATTVFSWDAEKDAFYTTLSGEKCYMGTFGDHVTMAVIRETNYQSTDYIARLYTMDNEGGSGTEPTPCEHRYTLVVTIPNCTNGGYTTYTCSLCSHSYTGNNVPATGHSYSNGACVDCGAAKPATPTATSATISFASTANRTEFNASKQVWATDGLTLTNNKAASTSNVADYSNPARFYASSSITVECARMKSIVFECSSSSYANALKDSITGVTASIDGSKVTVTFSTPVNSFTIEKLTAQVRVNRITVNLEVPAQCQHTNTALVGAVAATCTEDGYTGNTRCTNCGEITAQGTTVAATGHDMGEWTETTAPTATSEGTERRDCNNCNHHETRNTPALNGGNSGDAQNPTDTQNPNNSESGWNAILNAIMTFIRNLIQQIMGIFGGKE